MPSQTLKSTLKQSLLGLLLPGLLAMPAAAQDYEESEPDRPVAIQDTATITPNRLNVSGTQGATETRTLLLQTNAPVTNLQIIPLGLENTEGEAALPETAIFIDLSDTPADDFLSIPIEFRLENAPRSGEFSGTLLLKSDEGELKVPVTVKVKDRPWVALILLGLGVGLGIGVSAYRAQGKPRDRVLVRMGQLRAQMRTDPELDRASAFGSRIDTDLLDLEMALQAEQWDVAGEAIASAENIWVKWRKFREDWLAQIDYRDRLVQRLQQQEDLDPKSPYLQSVCRQMDSAIRHAPDSDPQKLRLQLDECGEQINNYLLLQGDLKHLNQLRDRVKSPEVEDSWRMAARTIERQIDRLKLMDAEAYRSLSAEIQKGIAELEPLTDANGSPLTLAIPRLMFAAPPVNPPLEKSPSRAQISLKIFSVSSYAIAVMILAGAGFIQLYVKHPTFGANRWSDYFTLLAWGFGAEATREAIAKVVRDWKAPSPDA